MINEDIKNEIKKHLGQYLEETGRNTKGFFTCLNPSHEDKNPSMSYDPKRNIVKCFSCNEVYDLIGIYALDKGLDEKADFKRIVEELADKYNITLNNYKSKNNYDINYYKKETNKEDFSKYLAKCKKDVSKTDYLEKRGISKELIEKYNIGYDVSKKMVILPISNTCYEGRAVEESNPIKHFKPKGISNEIFNLDLIKDSSFNSVVWVTEAIIDALSLEEAKKDIKVVSLNSINNSKQLLEELKKANYKGVIVLALDTDTNGLRTSQDLKEELDLLNIKSFIFNSNRERYGLKENSETEYIKDINEYLVNDKEKLIENVTYFDVTLETGLRNKAIETYEQENVFNYLDEFNEYILDEERTKALSTGIDVIDEALEGGFYKKNLVILGAISSMGKTTLALQIADNIARQKEDVLIFSLEMAKEELIAKSLSRLSFLNTWKKSSTYLAFTTKEVMRGRGVRTEIPNNKDRVEVYSEVLEEYKNDIAKNIYISECNETLELNVEAIDEKIKRHIAITGRKPFVIVDYLQIIKSDKVKGTDTQIVASIVTDLKRIARNNDITIFLISAFNRNSYSQEADLSSFRDSSTIEYTSDVLLSLQPRVLDGQTGDQDGKSTNKKKVNQEQQKESRELTLKVLKNRNGRITDVKGITFYAKYNYMSFKNASTNKED